MTKREWIHEGARSFGLNVWERIRPFIALLDARYLPLLFAVSPQSYAVYRWLWIGSDRSNEAFVFAVLGALGYELIYVGAIAWTEHQTFNGWTRATAWTALFFSIAIAVYVYRDQSYAAALHAGFPIVAFAYTMAMHTHGASDAKKETTRLSLREKLFGRATIDGLREQVAQLVEQAQKQQETPLQSYARPLPVRNPIQLDAQQPEQIAQPVQIKSDKPKPEQKKATGESKKEVVWRLAAENKTTAEIVAETGYDRSVVAPLVSRYKRSLEV